MENENKNMGLSSEKLLVNSMILNATDNEVTPEELQTLMDGKEYQNFSSAILNRTINMEQIQEVIRRTMERKEKE